MTYFSYYTYQRAGKWFWTRSGRFHNEDNPSFPTEAEACAHAHLVAEAERDGKWLAQTADGRWIALPAYA